MPSTNGSRKNDFKKPDSKFEEYDNDQTKIALAAALFAATSSAAFAQGYKLEHGESLSGAYSAEHVRLFRFRGTRDYQLRAGRHVPVRAGQPAEARQCSPAARAGAGRARRRAAAATAVAATTKATANSTSIASTTHRPRTRPRRLTLPIEGTLTMLTRTLALFAALVTSFSAASASAPATPDSDPTLINHPPAYTQVAEWTPQPALSGLRQGAPVLE